MQVQALDKLRWLGHASFLYVGPPAIYFDPYHLGKDLPRADLILISHEHGDHCSPEDVAKISGPGTVIVASQLAAPKLSAAARRPQDVRVLRPGEKLTVGGVAVEAVPAYNITKFRSPGQPFHPKPSQHNGYVVTVDGQRIYFAGDTDHIPEMDDIECDVALLPASGTYVMTAEEAAEAAQSIHCRVAVPMHYGAGVVGSAEDAARFKALSKGKGFVFGSDA